MENEQHSNQIQVITEDGKLCEDFNNYVKSTEFGKAGKNYHLISIIGNQSTGKSTLLNRVFGTTFDVMDASRVRKQTTKGISFEFIFPYPSTRYSCLKGSRKKYSCLRCRRC